MQLLSIYRKRQRLWHILFGTIVLLFLLGWLFLTLLVKSPKFQSFLVHTISKAISLNINGQVHIESVDLKFFKTVRINQFLIRSNENDTIIFINRLDADISLISIRRKSLIIDELNLEGAKINIQRVKQDSLFNIGKLLKTNTETTKNSSQKSLQWILSLKELGLQNSNIYFRDDKNKVSVRSTLKDFKLDIEKMDLKNFIFDCNSLSIVNPNTQIQVYGSLPKDSLPFIIEMPFELALNELNIKEGVFKYDDTKFPIKNNVFDVSHISVHEIECFIKNTSISKNEISASINNYSSIDNNKYTVHLTNTKFGMNNQSMYLQHLNLKTNHSKIQADAKLKFKDYKNFNPNHSMFSFNIQLKKGEIAMKDVQYFLQKPLPLNLTDINLTGKLTGSLNNIKLNKIDLLLNKKIIVKGDLLAKNISHIKELEINAESIFVNATLDDVRYLLPKDILIPDLIKNLGYVNYNGKFNGKINDFNSNGKLNTAIGDLITNLNIKYSYTDKTPSYKGLLSFEHINLQKLLQDTLLGFASLNVEIDGKGLVFEKINSTIKGQISSFDFKGYQYSNIKVDGQIEYKKFFGDLYIDDANLKGSLKGKINLANSIPEYNFIGKLEKLNFKALHISDNDWTISCFTKVNFTGAKIDDLIGVIDIDSFKLTDNIKHKTYQVDYFTFSSQKDKQQRSLTVYSDIINAELQGEFNVIDLPKVANQYFVSYFLEQKDTLELSKHVNINFDISLENTKKLIPLFAPDFKNINLAHIKGKLDTRSKMMSLNVIVKGLQYQKYSLSNFELKGMSNANSLAFTTIIDSIFQKDSLLISPLTVIGNYKDEKLLFNIKVQDNRASSRLNIRGQFENSNGAYNLKFLPSEIIINRKKWNIDQRNLFSYINNQFYISNFNIFHNKEALKIYTAENHKDLVLELKQIDLHDLLSNLIQKNNNYFGLINGKVQLKDYQGKLTPLVNLNIRQIIVNKDTIGNLAIGSSWNPDNQNVFIRAAIVGRYQQIQIDGVYKVKDEKNPLDINIQIKRFTPDVLDNFIADYMYDSKGDFSGTLKLRGSFSKPVLTGFMNINKFETTVNNIHTRYNLKNQIARFTEKGISFDGISINDRFGNIAYGGGTIYHDHLTNFFLDIFIKTGRFECMNTTYDNNNVFWGNLFGDVKYTMYGATDGIININLSGKAASGSELTLLLGNEKELEKYSFYSFRDKGIQKVENENRRSLFVKKSGVNIELDIEVTNSSKVHIIFDPSAEDKINAEGNGNIKLKVKKNGEFNIVGEYKVDKGDYLFTFQNAIKRKFYLRSGGTMTFVGDPLKSQIDIEAVLRTRASPYDLVQNYIDPNDKVLNNAAKIQVPLDLTLKLKNNLVKPDISFDITFLSYDNNLKTAFDNLSASMKNNENELNRQVFGILVLNRFMPPLYSPFPNNNLNTKDIQNTVTEYLSNQLSNYVSDWLTNFVTDVNFGVKYREYNQTGSSELSQDLRRELQLSISKKFANNRLIVNVGGNFDFGNQNNNNNTTTSKNFAGGDVELEYILTKDGNVRIRAFSKGQYDAFNSRSINRTGVGINYRQEFNDANEFFNILFNKKAK